MSENCVRINTQGRVIRVGSRPDHGVMTEYIDIMAERYPFLSVTSIGQTVLGKSIPMLSIGKGKKSVLYIGAQKGTESGSSAVLLRYVNEMCEYIASDARIYTCSASYLALTRTINVIPMLNPDGVDIALNGMPEEHITKRMFEERGIGVPDTSRWEGNARGIGLRENYSNSFDEGNIAGLEPESGALRNYLMFNRDIRLTLSFAAGERSVLCTHEGAAPPRLALLGKSLGTMCAADFLRKLCEGTLSVFCARELAMPSFEIRSEYCDGDGFADYFRQRRLLFLAPTLI